MDIMKHFQNYSI
ncbi:hypothetical protein KSF78_0005527 [Schistosoma japonicum]|nr:hypothetical protein KSF78_0005527 [Schistosoma japonicum]